MEPEDQMQQQEREQVQEEQQQEPTTSPTLSSSSISDPSQKRPSTTPAENTTTSSMGPTEQCQSENTVNATREPENPTSITSMLESSSQMPDNLKKPVVSTLYSRLSESNFVKIQKLRLKEKIHDDRMEIERWRLALLEADSKPRLDLKKRELGFKLIQGQIELLKELRAMGLSTAEAAQVLKNHSV